MTKGELIKILVDDIYPMDTEICVSAEVPHKDEYGTFCSGYSFPIKGLNENGILIDADWLLKKDKGEE